MRRRMVARRSRRTSSRTRFLGLFPRSRVGHERVADLRRCFDETLHVAWWWGSFGLSGREREMRECLVRSGVWTAASRSRFATLPTRVLIVTPYNGIEFSATAILLDLSATYNVLCRNETKPRTKPSRFGGTRRLLPQFRQD